jgi:hypothetical protein
LQLPGLGIAVVGALALWSGVLAATVLFIGRGAEAALYAATAAALGAWFWRLFDRWMTKLDADAPVAPSAERRR